MPPSTRQRRSALVVLIVALLAMATPVALAAPKANSRGGKTSNTTTTTAAPTTSTTAAEPTTSTTAAEPTTTTTVASTNTEPVPKITPPFEVAVGSPADVHSGSSYDPDGDPITWSWNGDPSFTVVKPSQIRFTPQQAGTYVVTVTVTDDKGASASKQTTVTATSTTSSTTSTTTVSSSGSTLWSNGFEETDWRSRWHLGMDSFPEKRSIVSGLPGSDGKAMQLNASKDNNGYTAFGADMRSRFADMGLATRNEAVLRYSVYVPSTWNPYAGGKLPGLAGISPGMGLNDTSGGGYYRESSWSGRMMWKAPADGNLDHTRVHTYLYVRSAGGRSIYDNALSGGRVYGICIYFRNSSGDLYLKRGQWNTFELRYVMNTPGQNNGILQGWLNGQLGVDLRDVQYRTAAYPDADLNELMFSSFYGGPTANTTDQTWAFDNVALKTTR